MLILPGCSDDTGEPRSKRFDKQEAAAKLAELIDDVNWTQTFVKTSPPMSGEYTFIPFGVRHDNPLYGIGDLNEIQLAVLQDFTKFLQSAHWVATAQEYGFSGLDDYQNAYTPPAGSILIKAQKVWKDKKDAGRPVVAVFAADISGSMAGPRIRGLKKALIEGSDFISTNNSIGLVTFSDTVNVFLPPKRFDLIQKSAFYAAVEDLDASGSTAMFDGILVALSLLLDAAKAEPNAKLVLFVLTDGETNRGYKFETVRAVIEGLSIPIYTIGYEADIDVLKRVSGLVEAATRNAAEGNVSYAIGSLLNAQM